MKNEYITVRIRKSTYEKARKAARAERRTITAVLDIVLATGLYPVKKEK
jgi:hypothetical protein